jgi:hypothetical protein
MAIVTELRLRRLETDSPHTRTECTYSVVAGVDGEKFLQIDTYGSKARKIPGKKSQSIRFTAEAVAQLRKIIEENF